MRYSMSMSGPDERGVPPSSKASAASRERHRAEPWFVIASLAAVALGVVLSVALLQYHFAYGGERTPTGVLQQLVVGLYSAIGFAPAVYLCVLLVVWGSVAFLTGRLRDPMRRIAASLLFCFCLSLLTGALGGNGGRFGAFGAERLTSVFGVPIVAGVLSLMALAALLLATDWFFLRGRIHATGSVSLAEPRERGVVPVEEDELAAIAAVASQRQDGETGGRSASAAVDAGLVDLAEQRRLRLGLVPRPRADGRADDSDSASLDAGRRREQELVDRVLEDARRDLDQAVDTAEAIDAAEMTEAAEGDRLDLADANDILAELEDEDLLERAGRALDAAWADAGIVGGLMPVDDAGDAAESCDRGELDVFAAAPDLEPSEGRARMRTRGDTDPLDDLLGEFVDEVVAEQRQDADDDSTVDAVDAPELDVGPVLQPVAPLAPREIDLDAPPQGVQERLFVDPPDDPDLLDRAAEVLLTARRPTPSLLQRRLDVSYSQAHELLDRLVARGALEEADGHWIRLMQLSDWQNSGSA